VDIQRGEEVKKAKQRKRIIMVALLVVGVATVTFALSRLKPAAPTVDRATVWLDTVKRGEMLRQVRGLGTLVPEEIRWIPATTQGRVERIILRPGALVKADSVILELSNPELEQEAVDAELQMKVAQAGYENLKVQLESQLLTLRSDVARAQADFTQNKLQAEADEALYKDGLVSKHVRDLSSNRAAESTTRFDLEKKRLENFAESMKAQLAAQQAQVEQRRAFYDLRRTQLDKLRVRAGFGGVLQALPVEVGQQVAPGTNLARVSDPTRLKAEVRIAETQARDIVIGQVASIDTRNGVIPGRVSRIDPAAVQGTVLVDVTLEGPLPQGARPDLSVDGTIELERLADVVYVGRPVQGQPNSTVGLFKLEADGVHAARVQVKLGRSSVNTIEIVEGLQVGDQVVLSDMSQVDNVDRIRLN
jgi:HlyD family secretion protein